MGSSRPNTGSERANRANNLLRVIQAQRPKTRGDCLPGGCNEVRPCGFISCRYHLYGQVTEGGGYQVNSDLEIEEWLETAEHTCVLDVIDQEGGMSAKRAGKLIGLSERRVTELVTEVVDILMDED